MRSVPVERVRRAIEQYSRDCVIRLKGYRKAWAATVIVLLGTLSPLSAQAGFVCSDASKDDLKQSIAAHTVEMSNLHEKFVTGWYGRKSTLHGVDVVDLDRILRNLGLLAPRRAALLFFAHQVSWSSDEGHFCAWLISPHLAENNVVGVETRLRLVDLQQLQSRLVASLGVIAPASSLMAKRKGEPQIQETTDFSPREALQRARSILLPTSILEALKSSRIDTLIVLPTFAIGTIPFGLLPVDERRALIDLVSVTIAPGFFVFERPPSVARASFGNAMIIGNPVGWNDKAMSAAAVQMFGNEAEAIAKNFGTKAMTGATKANVIARLGVEHPSLIYIAAHGRSDSVNPLDGGFLLLGDGPWTGREISRAPIGDSRPLVILSACQTGLGKDFDVGNIGLARAWYQAGASNVVMSLWSIYREATQNLMLRFTRYLSTCPPDQALQRAMIEQRGVGQDDPRLWAGFAIFGLPEHPGCTTPGP